MHRPPVRRRMNGMYVNALMQVNFGGYLENKYLSQYRYTQTLTCCTSKYDTLNE